MQFKVYTLSSFFLGFIISVFNVNILFSLMLVLCLRICK